MTCKKEKKWLSALLDGELSENRRRELDSHLRECSVCRRELAELRRLQDDLAGLPAGEVPPHFSMSVMEKIQPVQKFRIFSLPSLVYSLVFLLFFTLGFVLSSGNRIVSEEGTSPTMYSRVLVESQDLNLVSLDGKMLAMGSHGENQ